MKSILNIIAIQVAGILLSGCMILESKKIAQYSLDKCSSDLGHYFVPKRFLNLKVSQAANKPAALTLTAGKYTADQKHKFCIDYRGNWFFKDSIAIQRHSDTSGLLNIIKSRSEDETKKVVESILDAVVDSTNAAAGFRAAGTRLVSGDLLNEFFDPFEPGELSKINYQLAEYGFCVLFDVDRVGIRNLSSQCGRGSKWVSKSIPPGDWNGAIKSHRRKIKSGIFYRPNILQKFVVLQNTDPDGSSEWREHQNHAFLMPNEAPIFSVGVKRRLFIKTATILTFDHGVLRNVTIDKPSEIAGFVEIPLKVVQVAVAIPAQIVKIRINNTDNRAQIIDTQQKLLELHTARKSLENQLAAQQRSAPNFTTTALLPPNIASDRASIRQPRIAQGFTDNTTQHFNTAANKCSTHCNQPNNQSRLKDPATCPAVCLRTAKICLQTFGEPTIAECFKRGITNTEK